MKPSKCRLCGHEHWSYQDHVWPDEPLRGRDVNPEVNPPVNPVAIVNPIVNTPKVTGDKRIAKGGLRDRKAYNEYMRGWMERKRAGA